MIEAIQMLFELILILVVAAASLAATLFVTGMFAWASLQFFTFVITTAFGG